MHLDSWQQQEPQTYAAKCSAFLSFLDWVAHAGRAEHFVIAGDLLDVPPGQTRVEGQLLTEVGNRLGTLMRRGVRVHYLSGNHDIGLAGVGCHIPGVPVEIASRTVISSGDGRIAFEHGHLLDAWLWEFARRSAARCAPSSLPAVADWFAREGPEPEASDSVGGYLHDCLFAAMQWRPMTVGFTPEEQRWGLRAMGLHLDDDFADVAGPGEAVPHQAEIMSLTAALNLSVRDLQSDGALPGEALELFWPLGRRYYSPLPWRRAARRRLSALRRQDPAVSGLVMGHSHAADRYCWTEDGQRLQYANCGTWLGDSGSYVSVRSGELTAHGRSWKDPLP